jgi:hypothetical protein
VVDIEHNDEEVLPPQPLPRGVSIEVQLEDNPISPVDLQSDPLLVTETILRKRKLVPKKSLEVVITNLKDPVSIDY